jgi:hypothetical protein
MLSGAHPLREVAHITPSCNAPFFNEEEYYCMFAII